MLGCEEGREGEGKSEGRESDCGEKERWNRKERERGKRDVEGD